MQFPGWGCRTLSSTDTRTIQGTTKPMRVSEKRWKNAHIMPGERYRQRLREQAREREERNEVLTEVIEEALREVVQACQAVATSTGISDGKSVAEVIGRKIGGRPKDNPSAPLATTPTGS